MADNTGSVKSFRVAYLRIVTPPALAGGLMQTAVITPAVTLNAPACGYDQGASPTGGAGAAGHLNWLFQIDTAAKTIKTGGAPVSADPYKDGYCFLGKLPAGGSVPALTAPIELSGNTVTMSPQPGVLYITTFQSPMTSMSVWPLRAPRLEGVTLSPDGRCIGEINPEWYNLTGNTACADTTSACPKWFTAGAVAGFVKLSDLCGPLNPGAPPGMCEGPGDFCSTTESPGGCADSLWFSATFAANAVSIHGGGSPLCE